MASHQTEPYGTGSTPVAESDSELTFEWTEGRTKQRARIAFYFVLAAVLHAGFFYIFRVIYPSSNPNLPIPSRVLLLSNDDPAVRAVLAEVEDRTAAYDTSLGTIVGSVLLSDYTMYQPSFADHELQLQDLPLKVAKRLPLPDTLNGSPVVPPPVQPPMPDLPPRQLLPTGPQQPVLAFGGGIGKRELLYRPELTGIFSQSSDLVATFTLGVDAAGIVRYCLPDEEFQADQSEALRRAAFQADLKAVGRSLYQLRFKPSPESGMGLTWGSATIEW